LRIKPLPEVRLTLISPASDTPYSGMLPGHIAGVYHRDECHINLQRLAHFAQAQFYIDKVVGLDLNKYRTYATSTWGRVRQMWKILECVRNYWG